MAFVHFEADCLEIAHFDIEHVNIRLIYLNWLQSERRKTSDMCVCVCVYCEKTKVVIDMIEKQRKSVKRSVLTKMKDFGELKRKKSWYKRISNYYVRRKNPPHSE